MAAQSIYYRLGNAGDTYWSKGAAYEHFRSILVQAKISHTEKGPRLHDLRHTCASLLLNKGKGKVTMKDIQEWLGHSDYKTTANVYAHLDLSSKFSSLETLDSIIEI